MPNRYHISEIAERYNITTSAIWHRKDKMNLQGTFFTDEEAFRIGSFDGKLNVGYMYRTNNDIPSKLNFVKTQDLSSHKKQTQTLITK
jgi:predicted DNA-binding protein YlxM (UPF0122 family)